jgi:uncharacterized glyoxalase superfamily protein PhnB
VAPTIAVCDIAKALTFYCDVLGFSKTFENGNPVGFVILERDNAEVHLTLWPNDQATDRIVLHMLVSDANALFEHLKKSGARIVKGLRDQPYGLRDFVVADPEGNRLDIGQPLT